MAERLKQEADELLTSVASVARGKIARALAQDDARRERDEAADRAAA
jgi:hypothetical protein